MKSNKLVSLGAPVLPEGEFYRVCTRFGWPKVQVRRKRRIGSSLAGEATVFPYDRESATQAIVRAAAQARFSGLMNDRDRAIIELSGDYR
ncbi:hypothetical protein [Streptomyces sp. NPDC101249]|uniref:hypothetical protein n=1 Tax=Streptomyces sp. NPDC101249 TaxID=3366140 RepID=UPI003808583E